MEPSGSGDMETGQAGDTGLRKGMVDMPQIWMEGVSKFYQQEKKLVAAVQGIDLTVERQEFVVPFPPGEDPMAFLAAAGVLLLLGAKPEENCPFVRGIL